MHYICADRSNEGDKKMNRKKKRKNKVFRVTELCYTQLSSTTFHTQQYEFEVTLT